MSENTDKFALRDKKYGISAARIRKGTHDEHGKKLNSGKRGRNAEKMD